MADADLAVHHLHVSKYCYRKHFKGRVCTFKYCESQVRLTFPGDHSGPLATPPDTTVRVAADEFGSHVTALDWAE